MDAEDDHLTQLRRSYEAMREGGGDPATVAEAIRVLLRVSIAHHEQVQAKADDTVFNAGAFDPPQA